MPRYESTTALLNAPPAAEQHQAARKVLNDSLSISLFAYAGVLLRIAVKAVSASTGSSLLGGFGHGYFLQNTLGSLLMGFSKARTTSSPSAELLAAGFTTGLCGCLTTFATWMLSVNAALRGENAPSEEMDQNGTACTVNDGSGSAWDSVATSTLGCVVALASLRFGRQLAKTLRPSLLPDASWNWIHGLFSEHGETAVLLCLLLPVTLLVWILAAQDFATPAAAGSPPSDRWLAVAFAPLGAVLRYRLSKLNGKVLPHFPVGTFAANVAGSMIAAVLSIAASSLDANVSPARVAVLTAAGTGFTGSLSTVSTFANELDGLGTAPGADHPGGVGIAAGWRPYVYAAGSIVGVQAALLALHALNALAE
jgi:fluoride ion exporter CrcB/FEX